VDGETFNSERSSRYHGRKLNDVKEKIGRGVWGRSPQHNGGLGVQPPGERITHTSTHLEVNDCKKVMNIKYEGRKGDESSIMPRA
jgi:hypothetical protein